MTKEILTVTTLFLVSCATNPRIQSIYDARTPNQTDKELVQRHAKEYIDQLSAAGAIPLGAAHSVKATDTVQQMFCTCQKKLAQRCSSPADGLNTEEKDLWAKGNGAEIALVATGNQALADKHLCN